MLFCMNDNSDESWVAVSEGTRSVERIAGRIARWEKQAAQQSDRQQSASVAVTDRIEPPTVHAGGAEAVVDINKAPRCESDAVQADVSRMRAPPDRDQQLVDLSAHRRRESLGLT